MTIIPAKDYLEKVKYFTNKDTSFISAFNKHAVLNMTRRYDNSNYFNVSTKQFTEKLSLQEIEKIVQGQYTVEFTPWYKDCDDGDYKFTPIVTPTWWEYLWS